VLKRFLPASAASLGGIGAGLSLFSSTFGLPQLLVLGVEVAGLTLGFGMGLAGLGRFLFPDANVDRRRSVVAGLCSPLYLGLVSLFTQGSGILEIAGWSALVGIGVATAMFFPWLSKTPAGRQPEPPSLSKPERQADEEPNSQTAGLR
jgi:hypothetical protein